MNESIAGRYRLLEQIGSGGMADVWKAEDARTGETVAVKRLHPHLAADDAARARFRREIEAASAVRHPSAVRVLDSGEDELGPWLVMDYVAGGSLADRLRTGPVREADALAIAADVADVLAALHAAGMVHRDVTPGNILLGDGNGARLADFGIARGEAVDGMDDVTATGDVVGTMRFLAPEVLAGAAASPASDTWSLGAVLYEMLVGRSPFDASSPAALIASQDAPLAMPRAIRGDLQALVAAMLRPLAATRPAGFAVAASLRGMAGSPPSDDVTMVIPIQAPIARPAPTVNAPTFGEASRVVPPPDVRHRPVALAAVAALLLGAVLVAIVLGVQGANPGGSAPVRPTASLVLTSPTASPRPASPGTTPVPVDSGKGNGKGSGNGKGKGPKP